MDRALIVFDMDGVLVDVTESFRETIVRTVEHFTGAPVSREQIQAYKNRGGFNDDWKLSHQVIRERGVTAEYQAVVEHFQHIFHGNGTDGLILRERWIAREGLFERLAARYEFAIFTGRMRWEAEVTLQRFAAGDRKIFYVGDSVDDARSARGAGVPFIGIASATSLERTELVSLFEAENAIAIIGDINELESVLP